MSIMTLSELSSPMLIHMLMEGVLMTAVGVRVSMYFTVENAG